jgi:O-succinylbenzoic acid--CoA ligase
MSAREYLGDNSPLTDSENWFLTNDTGFIKDEKLFVTGRIDDQIISGGEKVSLGAIDSYLNGEFHLEFMCCALPHPEWGQALCLAASTSFDITRIKSALRARFGNQAVPKLFLENVELPRTPLGKPDRRNLAQRFEMMSL